MAFEEASVHSIRALLDRPTARPHYFDYFRSLGSFHDVEFNCFIFSYTLSYLLRVVSHDGCVVEEDILPGVIAVDDAVYYLLLH